MPKIEISKEHCKDKDIPLNITVVFNKSGAEEVGFKKPSKKGYKKVLGRITAKKYDSKFDPKRQYRVFSAYNQMTRGKIYVLQFTNDQAGQKFDLKSFAPKNNDFETLIIDGNIPPAATLILPWYIPTLIEGNVGAGVRIISPHENVSITGTLGLNCVIEHPNKLILLNGPELSDKPTPNDKPIQMVDIQDVSNTQEKPAYKYIADVSTDSGEPVQKRVKTTHGEDKELRRGMDVEIKMSEESQELQFASEDSPIMSNDSPKDSSGNALAKSHLTLPEQSDVTMTVSISEMEEDAKRSIDMKMLVSETTKDIPQLQNKRSELSLSKSASSLNRSAAVPSSETEKTNHKRKHTELSTAASLAPTPSPSPDKTCLQPEYEITNKSELGGVSGFTVFEAIDKSKKPGKKYLILTEINVEDFALSMIRTKTGAIKLPIPKDVMEHHLAQTYQAYIISCPIPDNLTIVLPLLNCILLNQIGDKTELRTAHPLVIFGEVGKDVIIENKLKNKHIHFVSNSKIELSLDYFGPKPIPSSLQMVSPDRSRSAPTPVRFMGQRLTSLPGLTNILSTSLKKTLKKLEPIKEQPKLTFKEQLKIDAGNLRAFVNSFKEQSKDLKLKTEFLDQENAGSTQELKEKIESSYKPMAHQLRVMEQLAKAWEQGDIPHAVFEQATGTGKTNVVIDIFRAISTPTQTTPARKRKMLFVVPLTNLNTQTIERFQEVAGKQLKIKALRDGRKALKPKHIKETFEKADVIVCTIQTLCSEKSQGKIPFERVDIVVIDEAHTCLSVKRAKLIREKIMHSKKSNCVVLAVTATPFLELNGARTVYELLGFKADGSDNPIKPFGIQEAILENINCPVATALVYPKNCDQIKFKRVANGKLNQKNAEMLINHAKYRKMIVMLYMNEADSVTHKPFRGMKGIVFCAGVKHAIELAQEFNSISIEAVDPTGQLRRRYEERAWQDYINRKKAQFEKNKFNLSATFDAEPYKANWKQIFEKEYGAFSIAQDIHCKRSAAECDKILRKSRLGGILILTGANKLIEGYDDPEIELIIRAAPSLSSRVVIQSCGRGLRGDKNNPNKILYVLEIAWGRKCGAKFFHEYLRDKTTWIPRFSFSRERIKQCRNTHNPLSVLNEMDKIYIADAHSVEPLQWEPKRVENHTIDKCVEFIDIALAHLRQKIEVYQKMSLLDEEIEGPLPPLLFSTIKSAVKVSEKESDLAQETSMELQSSDESSKKDKPDNESEGENGKPAAGKGLEGSVVPMEVDSESADKVAGNKGSKRVQSKDKITNTKDQKKPLDKKSEQDQDESNAGPVSMDISERDAERDDFDSFYVPAQRQDSNWLKALDSQMEDDLNEKDVKREKDRGSDDTVSSKDNNKNKSKQQSPNDLESKEHQDKPKLSAEDRLVGEMVDHAKSVLQHINKVVDLPKYPEHNVLTDKKLEMERQRQEKIKGVELQLELLLKRYEEVNEKLDALIAAGKQRDKAKEKERQAALLQLTQEIQDIEAQFKKIHQELSEIKKLPESSRIIKAPQKQITKQDDQSHILDAFARDWYLKNTKVTLSDLFIGKVRADANSICRFAKQIIFHRPQSLLEVDPKTGNSLLHIAIGSYTNTHFLLSQRMNVNAVNKEGNTPLHLLVLWASKNNKRWRDFSLLIELLTAPGININAQNNNGDTALHLTAQHGVAIANHIAMFLLGFGARTDIKNKQGFFASNIVPVPPVQSVGDLPESASSVMNSVVPTLSNITGSGLNIQGPKGISLLHIALFYAKNTAVSMLLQRGAPCNLRDFVNRTPIYYALEAREYDDITLNSAVTNMLAHGLDVNIFDNFGKRPVEVALNRLYRIPDVVLTLMQHTKKENLQSKKGTYYVLFFQKILEGLFKSVRSKTISNPNVFTLFQKIMATFIDKSCCPYIQVKVDDWKGPVISFFYSRLLSILETNIDILKKNISSYHSNLMLHDFNNAYALITLFDDVVGQHNTRSHSDPFSDSDIMATAEIRAKMEVIFQKYLELAKDRAEAQPKVIFVENPDHPASEMHRELQDTEQTVAEPHGNGVPPQAYEQYFYNYSPIQPPQFLSQSSQYSSQYGYQHYQEVQKSPQLLQMQGQPYYGPYPMGSGQPQYQYHYSQQQGSYAMQQPGQQQYTQHGQQQTYPMHTVQQQFIQQQMNFKPLPPLGNKPIPEDNRPFYAQQPTYPQNMYAMPPQQPPMPDSYMPQSNFNDRLHAPSETQEQTMGLERPWPPGAITHDMVQPMEGLDDAHPSSLAPLIFSKASTSSSSQSLAARLQMDATEFNKSLDATQDMDLGSESGLDSLNDSAGLELKHSHEADQLSDEEQEPDIQAEGEHESDHENENDSDEESDQEDDQEKDHALPSTDGQDHAPMDVSSERDENEDENEVDEAEESPQDENAEKEEEHDQDNVAFLSTFSTFTKNFDDDMADEGDDDYTDLTSLAPIQKNRLR